MLVAPVRVLVVDDSVVVRRLVSDALSSDPDIEVVGTASNGRLALTKLAQVAPDLVTLDIEMPEMDGIAALRQLRADGHRIPVIMFSTLTERGASATLDALEAGASDYVTKPSNSGSISDSLEQVRTSLVPKIKALVPPVARSGGSPGSTLGSAQRRPLGASAATRDPATTLLAPRQPRQAPYEVLAIGCSTGGPEALSTLLGLLPADLRVPVVVVQHMPPVFTRQFAARLDRNLPFTVVEAEGGERLRPGLVVLAPGDYHLRLRRLGDQMLTTIDQQVPENFCRPAVDVLFRSAAQAYGAGVLATVLTGMGSDGRRGSLDVVGAGGSVLVQDEQSSVVWGMPGSVVEVGAAEEVLPLSELAASLVRRVAVAAPGQSGMVVGSAR
ncbi:protein-glutamate methylesterase/protein-glutamine glutaminase [Angustibacter sp. McL0619]|uniref:protein-glutamate methylesterase/protein-glutamine glutaminase n=1 Tax=Angustibacter sp. McL0619 TaxID=3415676 RepID=UPI003CFB4DF6